MRGRRGASSLRVSMNIVFGDGVGGGGCKYPIDQEGEKEGREGGKRKDERFGAKGIKI